MPTCGLLAAEKAVHRFPEGGRRVAYLPHGAFPVDIDLAGYGTPSKTTLPLPWLEYEPRVRAALGRTNGPGGMR